MTNLKIFTTDIETKALVDLSKFSSNPVEKKEFYINKVDNLNNVVVQLFTLYEYDLVAEDKKER